MRIPKTRAIALIGLASLAAFLAAACSSPADEKTAIEKVIRDNIAWALTKDRPLDESTMARDESLFIFNPTSESTIGWSQLVKNFDFWMDPRFKATKCEIWDMRIGVARSGDVAWWSCMLNDLAEWDGKPTPAWARSASTAVSLAASAPVCDEAARAPAFDFPDFTAMIGLVLVIRDAISKNFRGFPKLSTYIRITCTSGSCSHCNSRSLPLTFGLLPTDTNCENPIPYSAA